MGLIACPDCGNMVSDRAAACPHCGCPAEAFFENEQQEYFGGSGGSDNGGSSFLGGVLKTAVGVALGNKISERGKENAKRNYMDSPNCERAKTGFKSSCWGCGLADYCTMHDKY